MPIHVLPRLGLPRPDARAFLDRMPGADVPVIRQPFDVEDVARHPFLSFGGDDTGHRLFDGDDWLETEDLAGSARERHYVELLRQALADVEAPDEHHIRLGLT